MKIKKKAKIDIDKGNVGNYNSFRIKRLMNRKINEQND